MGFKIPRNFGKLNVENNKTSMTEKTNHAVDIQKYFLLGVLVLLIVSLMLFMSKFIGTLLICAVVVTGVYPVHKLLHKKLRFPSTISTLISLTRWVRARRRWNDRSRAFRNS